MPSPSYTIDTLNQLKQEYPGVQFSIIMGTDNIATIDKWKDYRTILSNHLILVYPRLGSPEPTITHPNIKLTKAPLVELSSTNIRSWVKAGKDVRHFIPLQVYQYIVDERLCMEVEGSRCRRVSMSTCHKVNESLKELKS